MHFLFNVHPFIFVTTGVNVPKIGPASSQTGKADGTLCMQERGQGEPVSLLNLVFRGLTVPSGWVRMALCSPHPPPLQLVLVRGTQPKENLHGQLWRKRTSRRGRPIRLLHVIHLDGWRGVVTYPEQV